MLGSLLAAWLLSSPAWPAAPAAAACTAPEYRQFDFWLGDWDVFESSDRTRVVARVQVRPILDGCGLLETYADLKGHQGRSFSIYDATRRVWHQTWLTNNGQLLVIEGGLQSGKMQLAGSDRARDGAAARLVRGTWEPGADGVRELAVRSLDDGHSWQPWFDLAFRRHPAPRTP